MSKIKIREKKDGAIRDFDLHSPKVKILCAIIIIVCLLIFIVCVFPAIWVLLVGFKDLKEFRKSATIFPTSYDFAKMQKTWNQLKFYKYYFYSGISVAGSVVCAVIFNGLLAYVIGVMKPKGYKIAYGLVMWSLLIPATTSIVSVVRNINIIGLQGSFLPLWLSFGANAFYVVLFKEFFEKLPQEIMEAAKLDGCGPLQIFMKIVIPMSRPIIMVVAIFSLTAAWSDFLLPYLVLNGSGKETVMVKLFAFKDTPTDAVSVLRAVLFSIIPPTILFALFQKQITDGAANGGVKG